MNLIEVKNFEIINFIPKENSVKIENYELFDSKLSKINSNELSKRRKK
jgi:hypothetical protein